MGQTPVPWKLQCFLLSDILFWHLKSFLSCLIVKTEQHCSLEMSGRFHGLTTYWQPMWHPCTPVTQGAGTDVAGRLWFRGRVPPCPYPHLVPCIHRDVIRLPSAHHWARCRGHLWARPSPATGMCISPADSSSQTCKALCCSQAGLLCQGTVDS